MPLQAGREHFHYMLMRAGLSGRQVLAVLVAFSVFYAAVGLIGARNKLPDWALFAPWFTRWYCSTSSSGPGRAPQAPSVEGLKRRLQVRKCVGQLILLLRRSPNADRKAA